MLQDFYTVSNFNFVMINIIHKILVCNLHKSLNLDVFMDYMKSLETI